MRAEVRRITNQQAVIRVQADGKAKLLADALRPEMEVTERSSVEILAENDDLVIIIQAEDVVSLRAATNSYMRWTKLAIDSQNAIGDE